MSCNFILQFILFILILFINIIWDAYLVYLLDNNLINEKLHYYKSCSYYYNKSADEVEDIREKITSYSI